MKQIDHLTRMLDCINRDPDDGAAYAEAGTVLYRLQETELALEYLKVAYRLLPENQDVLFNYAYLLENNKKYEEALSFYDTYIKRYPKEPEARRRRMELHYQLGIPIVPSDFCRGGILDEEN